ncbi:MAG: cytochrome c biogenesis protein ResB [Candidatus Firestonebacteria bacterium]|nr:cytochrome c biogenesis protein ResB [Candidatus Firestonebacteria bacterium]
MFENNKVYPLWKFFTKIKLALFLIIILIIITGINTFVSPQNTEESLGLELYHSWWYIFLLIVLFINIFICSIDRLPFTIKLTSRGRYHSNRSEESNPNIPTFTRETIAAYPITHTIKDTSSEKFNKILDSLNGKHYYINHTDNCIFAEKGKIRYWGSYLIHFGILLFITGYIIGKTFGALGTARLYNNSNIDSYYNWYNNKFESFKYEIQLENLTIEYYPPKVNIEIIMPYTNEKYLIQEKEKIEIKNTPYILEFYRFVPDAMFKDGLVYEISKVVGNICFVFRIYENNRLLSTYFLFSDTYYVNAVENVEMQMRIDSFKILENEVKGDLVFIDKQKKEIIEKCNIRINDPVKFNDTFFYLTQYGQDEFKNLNIGLQISKDPGLVMVWISFIFLVSGVAFSFFIYHKKIIVLKDNKDIIIGGTCNKNQYIIEREIEKII